MIIYTLHKIESSPFTVCRLDKVTRPDLDDAQIF